VLIARNKEKTETLAADIAKEYNVKTKVLIFDFSMLQTED